MKQMHEFTAALDRAVTGPDDETVVEQVKGVLLSAVGDHFTLPDEFYRPNGEQYARRLLHRDPKKRYSVVVMVWGPGQGTPLHDHGNLWCVECVFDGKIEVQQFEHRGMAASGSDLFNPQEAVIAEFGEAGHLIPPFEYHTIKNALPNKSSVTIHVYGGEYQECNIYIPEGDGSYRRETKVMTYCN